MQKLNKLVLQFLTVFGEILRKWKFFINKKM